MESPHRRHHALLCCLLLLGVGLAGCSQEEEPAPPEIRELIMATSSLILDDGYESLSGVFEFEDPNGDVESVMFEVVLPGGSVEEVGPLALEDVAGKESGSVSFTLVYSRDMLGLYEITVWLVDSQGQLSNELTGEIRSRW